VIMLLPRVIPVLLVQNGGLVKTVKFSDPKYVGDPLNAVKIFNEKEADELVVLDIDASAQGREPDYKLIENLAVECRMPLCYGGGIKSVEQAQKILSLGVEKVALSSGAIKTPFMVEELSQKVGAQSVVVVLDVKKRRFSRNYDNYIINGKTNTKTCPIEMAQKFEKLGAGEVVVNSIEYDGMMQGYDLEFVSRLKKNISLPVTALGGAGSYQDVKTLIDREGIIGAAAGSLFVFKGKYRAVLINYPKPQEKRELLGLV